MKKCVLAWAWVLMWLPVCSQEKNYLKVGDRMPDVVLGTYNFKTGEESKLFLQQPGKRLTILCFWATWSASSAEALPLLEKIPNDSVQVILINTEENRRVADFLDFRRQSQKLSLDLPYAEGTELTKHILIRSLPHCVWLNEYGIIQSITDATEVTTQNVGGILADDKYAISQKPDTLPWRFNQVLFAAGNGGNGEQIKSRSVLSRRVKGAPATDVIAINENGNKVNSIIFSNMSLKEMYQVAFQTDTAKPLRSIGIPNLRTIVKIKDTSHLVAWVNGEFVNNNTYVYQVWSQKTEVDDLRRMMREDLQRYFGLRARMVKKKKDVWVLRCRNPAAMKTKGGTDSLKLDEATGMILKNIEAAWVTRCFYDMIRDKITVDETGMTGNVDFVLRANLTDPVSINEGLRPLGMTYTREERIIEVLELDDPDPLDTQSYRSHLFDASK